MLATDPAADCEAICKEICAMWQVQDRLAKTEPRTEVDAYAEMERWIGRERQLLASVRAGHRRQVAAVLAAAPPGMERGQCWRDFGDRKGD